MVNAPIAHVQWAKYYRLINSAYPPIDLFEDIADPADWGLLGLAEGRTSPRLEESIGNIDLVPKERRVGGAGASYVMAPFTHVSSDKKGRFHDGSFGAYYGADSFETALFETIHHQQQFCRCTKEAAGWLSDMRELIGKIDAEMVDICGDGFEDLRDLESYAASQAFAVSAKDQGADGVLYPSVRNEGGLCFAAFYPDVAGVPKQGRHIQYHWDGERIDLIKDMHNGSVFRVEI